MARMTANASFLTAEDSAGNPAVAALLADLDITVVEAGPATASRKCSTDNGCDTAPGASADIPSRLVGHGGPTSRSPTASWAGRARPAPTPAWC